MKRALLALTADLAVFRELLAENFIEIGPDGARYDRAAVLRIIGSSPPQVVTASVSS